MYIVQPFIFINRSSHKTDSVWIRILPPPFLPSHNKRTFSPFSLFAQLVEMTYQNGKSFLKRNRSIIVKDHQILTENSVVPVVEDVEPVAAAAAAAAAATAFLLCNLTKKNWKFLVNFWSSAGVVKINKVNKSRSCDVRSRSKLHLHEWLQRLVLYKSFSSNKSKCFTKSILIKLVSRHVVEFSNAKN